MHAIHQFWHQALDLVRGHAFCPVATADLDAIRSHRERCPSARHATVVYRTPIIHTRHRKMQHLDWLHGADDARRYWWEVHRHQRCDKGQCAVSYAVIECDEHLSNGVVEQAHHASLGQAIREADAWDQYYRRLFAHMDCQP